MTEVSRRALLVGTGMAGLGTFTAGTWVHAAEGDNAGSGVPTNQGFPTSLAVTPGLSYVGMSGYTLQSRSATDPVTDVSGLGAGPRPAGAVVNCDIAVPHGAVLREFYLSGAGGTSVDLKRQIFGVYAHGLIVTATLPAGAGLQETKVLIDPPFVHDSSVESILFRAFLSDVQAVSSLAIGYTPASLSYVPLPTPKRCYDSRPNADPGIKGLLGVGQERLIDVTLGPSGVPANAAAVVGNVTITGTVGTFGWIDLRPNGVPYANTSTVNFTAPNQTVANAFTASLGPAATLIAKCDGIPGVATHFLIDVVGYYV